MPEIQYGGHTLNSHGRKLARNHLHDWLILLLLAAIDGGLNAIEPFHRNIGEDMMTDLKHPFKVRDTIPMWAVPIFAVILPFTIFLIYYLKKKNVYDLHHATLGILYSVLVTAVITDSIKDVVGRPRPKFFWRCFPDGVVLFSPRNGYVLCLGEEKFIKEGYKSFPSGHTSWSFAGLGFLLWYLCGKVKAFDQRGHVSKILIILLPYPFAALIGISRVDDYWHHWTDVFTRALIGSVVSSMCYLQFFPFPNSINGESTPLSPGKFLFEPIVEMSRIRQVLIRRLDTFKVKILQEASNGTELSITLMSEYSFTPIFLASSKSAGWATYTFLRMLEENGNQNLPTEMDAAYV